MAKLSREQVIKELETLGVAYDAEADYGDLSALLKASKPAAETKTPEENAAANNLPVTSKDIKKELGVTTEMPKLVLSDAAKLEKQIRYYVKRSGGFVKGLKPEQIEFAKELLKKAGREKPEWDESIQIGK